MTSSSLLCAFKSDNNITVKCIFDGIYKQVLSQVFNVFLTFELAAKKLYKFHSWLIKNLKIYSNTPLNTNGISFKWQLIYKIIHLQPE